jgi:hypothetical protein
MGKGIEKDEPRRRQPGPQNLEAARKIVSAHGEPWLDHYNIRVWTGPAIEEFRHRPTPEFGAEPVVERGGMVKVGKHLGAADLSGFAVNQNALARSPSEGSSQPRPGQPARHSFVEAAGDHTLIKHGEGRRHLRKPQLRSWPAAPLPGPFDDAVT